jgi:hypothetical protein
LLRCLRLPPDKKRLAALSVLRNNFLRHYLLFSLRFKQLTQKVIAEEAVRVEPLAVSVEGFLACATASPEVGQKVLVERAGRGILA